MKLYNKNADQDLALTILSKPDEVRDGKKGTTGRPALVFLHEQYAEYSPTFCEEEFDTDLSEDIWTSRHEKRSQEQDSACSSVKPSTKDFMRRFYAILPYFDKDHANKAFLHKYRATVSTMSEAADALDRELALYAAVITPLVFLHRYRDMWCFLERFHKAMLLYQTSHPNEKRSSLKLLQNLRNVNQKIRSFMMELPGPAPVTRTVPTVGPDDEDLHDKRDIRYLKELIKNLG